MAKSEQQLSRLIKNIKKLEKVKTVAEKASCEGTIISQIERAFEELDFDFPSQIMQRLYDDGFDEQLLNDVSLYFDCCSSFYTGEKTESYALIVFPILTSSAYGLPSGRLPDEVLQTFYKDLRKILPSHYGVRVNSDILSSENFSLTPYQMQKRLIAWTKKSREGICTFLPSEEPAEISENLIADIRVIAVIVSCPRNESFQGISALTPSRRKFSRMIASNLRRTLSKHYIATRFEFGFCLSLAFKRYLTKVCQDDPILETFFLPPVLTLTEAGKAFMHFCLKEALANVRQLFNLDIKDLQLAIAPFYESPSVGCLSLMEFRLGISKKGDDSHVIQGVVWPIFFSHPNELLATLEQTLVWHGFTREQVKLVAEEPFQLSDDEEDDYLYPAFDGKLHEIQPPQESQTAQVPSSLRLN